jgi:Zn-finger protein
LEGDSIKNTTCSYLHLDIRSLKRKGFLRPSGWVCLHWSRNGEPFGSIRIRAEFDWVVLSYRHQRYGQDWKTEEYPVFLDRTRCNYGGKRLWFLCPARGCSRRIAILYGGSIFACRDCHQLAYESQREAPYNRALSRAQAIRMKLGGSPDMTEDFPDKPKGMHWRTYNRLCAAAQEAQTRSWPPWLTKSLLQQG